MILPESYHPEWIKEKRSIYTKSDPGIMEKVIYALSLVEMLATSNLSFTFKGGTSLLLILPEPKRFSIDVDIVTLESREMIENTLTNICKGTVFSKFELDKNRSYKPGIPKAHYILTFYSQWDQKEKQILLDILYEDHGYPSLILTPIQNEWVKTDENVIKVNIPTVDSITGDKLTAFAPNTVGIRFKSTNEKGGITEKQMEVMKQLFDLGILFDRVENIEHLKKSFNNTAKKEIGYRSIDEITIENILDDIINTALIIGTEGKIKDDYGTFEHVKTGLSQLKSFIYNGAFRLDEAVVASAKAAYMAALIKTNHTGEIAKWNSEIDISNYIIESTPFNILNKKSKLPGGALFYWNKTIKILNYY
jgi:hypothetical protein